MVAGRKPKTNTRRIHRSNELEKRKMNTPIYQSQKFIAPTTLTEKRTCCLELVSWYL